MKKAEAAGLIQEFRDACYLAAANDKRGCAEYKKAYNKLLMSLMDVCDVVMEAESSLEQKLCDLLPGFNDELAITEMVRDCFDPLIEGDVSHKSLDVQCIRLISDLNDMLDGEADMADAAVEIVTTEFNILKACAQ